MTILIAKRPMSTLCANAGRRRPRTTLCGVAAAGACSLDRVMAATCAKAPAERSGSVLAGRENGGVSSACRPSRNNGDEMRPSMQRAVGLAALLVLTMQPAHAQDA